MTVGDAVTPFFQGVAGRRKFVMESMENVPALVSAFAKRGRDAAKEIAARAIFGGVPENVLAEHGQNMARRIAGSWLRTDVLARLRWHQEQGHYTVIVSASFGASVGPLGSRLGVNHGPVYTSGSADEPKAAGTHCCAPVPIINTLLER